MPGLWWSSDANPQGHCSKSEETGNGDWPWRIRGRSSWIQSQSRVNRRQGHPLSPLVPCGWVHEDMSHGDNIEKEPGSWMNTWRKKLIPSLLSHIGLWFGLFVCVYTCLWVFTYVCVYWCRFACVCGGQRSTLSLVCQRLSTVFGDQVCCLAGAQTGWARGCVGRPSSRALRSCVSSPPGCKHVPLYFNKLHSFMWVWESNSDPHTYIASSLSTESSSLPWSLFIVT